MLPIVFFFFFGHRIASFVLLRAREVVAIGGPTAEDHPDLFLLLQKMDDHGAPSTSGGPMANDGAGAEDEMITTL